MLIELTENYISEIKLVSIISLLIPIKFIDLLFFLQENIMFNKKLLQKFFIIR